MHGFVLLTLATILTGNEYFWWMQVVKNTIRDVRSPQPGEIVFNTMRYRRSETV